MMPHQYGPLLFATAVLIVAMLRDWVKSRGDRP